MLLCTLNNGGYVIAQLQPWQVFLLLRLQFAVFFTALGKATRGFKPPTVINPVWLIALGIGC